jgi:serine/threonine protein phosphatase 1
MKTFVIGDIHGSFRALLQCFERSGFDYEADRLISLGDLCDGYVETRQCIDELLKLKHLDLVSGNHDLWLLDWALRRKKPRMWLEQGGESTIRSYRGGDVQAAHIDLLKGAKPYIVIDNVLFVHGGFIPQGPISLQSLDILAWDRNLLQAAWDAHAASRERRFSVYDEIYIGHTPTQMYDSDKPLHLANVWAMDTGAGWSGKLTIMDVVTHEYWQSDPTPELYGGVSGRSYTRG